ncbi:MAG: M48 family metallopeptidase [Chitinophagaceae bacterium]|nr:M48 family metallopeptidase [Chitinophagaceae bacterium]
MKNILVIASLALLAFVGCSKNSITGRKQLSLLPESELRSMATTEYQQFLSQNKVVSTSASKDAEMVRRVGQRLVNAINAFYSKKGLTKELEGYQWEYNLVDSKEVNAWCMPGGKIVVYTGLLPVTQNEAALAVVLGHEITHALAHHGNERMSQEMVAQGIGVVGGVLTSGNAQVSNIFNSVYAPGAQVGVLLPNSRKQELEADRYGLIFTAMAGYNPQEAIGLWERMKALSGSNKPPEFLSTHPAEDTRIEKLKELMPEALKYYKPMNSK